MGHGRRGPVALVSVAALLLAAPGLGGCGGDDEPSGDAGVALDGSGGGGTDGSARDGGGPPGDAGGSGRDGGGSAGALACPALPPSGGTEVRIGPERADELPAMVRDAAPGTTFLLEDGTYTFTATDEGSRRLQIRAEGVTIRSADDDAEAVILDGEYVTEEIVTIQASNVTVAHLTLTRAVNHPVHVFPAASGENVTGTLLYGVRVLDGGEQFVKVNPNGARDAFVDDGRVECSLFRMTDEGRPHVERSPGGCYTGGIDAHAARGWVVRNNRFEDIYCAGEGLAEHAVHFWTGSRDTLVENNTIVRCARGIGLGLVESGAGRDYVDDPYPGVGYIGHYDGVVRNNVVFADHGYYDTGIELAQARGARVLHNTIWSTTGASGFFSSIDYRFPNSVVEIRNNLVRRITQRDGASGTVESNYEGATAELFVDPATPDLHLQASATVAIDQGVELDGAGIDIDGEPHTKGAAPDLGADEF